MDYQEAVSLSSKILEAREALKFIWGDEYSTKMEKLVDLICLISNEKRVSPVEFSMKLATLKDPDVTDQMRIEYLAAAVELSERGEV